MGDQAARGQACFTVDLDGLWCYREIHGLAPQTRDIDAAYSVGLRRLLQFLEDLQIPATLFVIGRDVDNAAHAAILTEAEAAGHELASHSYAHDYALRRQSRTQIREDIVRAHEALTALTGAPPVGFRTPGYNVDLRILAVLAELGYLYDSSVFPCPPYWLAKGGVMTWLSLRGRPSRSSMTRAETLFTPLRPYRPDPASVRRVKPTSRLPLEIPMCVVPGVRFPIIGTSLHLLGARGFGALYPALRRAHPDLLNLEFHVIDFMDAADPDVGELAEVQPDVRVEWEKKRQLYQSIVDIVRRDYDFVPMRDAATQLSKETT